MAQGLQVQVDKPDPNAPPKWDGSPPLDTSMPASAPAGGIIPYNANDPTQRSLLSLINTSEGSPTHDQGEGYVDLSGVPRDNHGFPVWGGRQGPQGRTHAAGSFQFEPHTWSQIASQHNLDFRKPQDQEAGAWYLAQQVYRQKTGGDLATAIKKGDMASVRQALASTWATQKGVGVRSHEKARGSTAPAAGGVENPFALPPDKQAMVDEDVTTAHSLLHAELAGYEEQRKVNEGLLKALDAEQERSNEAYDRFNKANDALIAAMPDQFKMQQQRLLEVSSEPLQPSRVLGQFMPMMAVLLGAFGKAGVVGSLNAAAAAANAARGHDEKAVQQANEEFKNQLQEVMDKSTLVHEQLSEAIAQSQGNVGMLTQRANIVAAQFQIPALERAAYMGDANSIIAANASLTKGITEMIGLQKGLAEARRAEVTANAQANKRTTMFSPSLNENVNIDPNRPAGQQIVDVRTDQPINPQPTDLVHPPSARAYSPQTAYLQTQRQKWAREHPGVPIPPEKEAEWSGNFNSYTSMIKDMATGKLGSNINAFNTALMHLDTLEHLAPALKSGDLQAVNYWSNVWKTQTGQPAPTNFQQVAHLVNDEIVKVWIPSGGGQGDREAQGKALNVNGSPEQISGAITNYRDLMYSKIAASKQQFDAATHDIDPNADFYRYLTPKGAAFFRKASGEKQPGGAGLSQARKQAWVLDVEKGRARIRAGRADAAAVREALQGEYPDASDAQLDAAVAGVR